MRGQLERLLAGVTSTLLLLIDACVKGTTTTDRTKPFTSSWEEAIRSLATITLLASMFATVACDDDTRTAVDPVGPIAPPAPTAGFVDNVSEAFGSFGGIPYVRITGRLQGTTARGDFRVPIDIIAPFSADLGNRTVLVEPAHFAVGAFGRDLILGREFLFSNGFVHAAVGWSVAGPDSPGPFSILDPGATDVFVAGGQQVADEEIVAHFARALKTDPAVTGIIGDDVSLYAFGVSQTAGTLLELQLTGHATGLFDMTLLNLALWPNPRPDLGFPNSQGEFRPQTGLGAVLLVQSEGDLVNHDAEQMRRWADLADARVYEIAGMAHQPQWEFFPGTNPIDYRPISRAVLMAGDAWVKAGVQPPPSLFIESAPAGEVDPVYGFPTGVARDGNLNALGGVRHPDVVLGRAQFVATVEAPIFGIPDLLGAVVDLACHPLPDGSLRFASHADYVSRFEIEVQRLQAEGFLLEADAAQMIAAAAASDVGNC